MPESRGKLNVAIAIASEASVKYPDENIFVKILGDLYLQDIQRYSNLAQELKRYMVQFADIKALADIGINGYVN